MKQAGNGNFVQKDDDDNWSDDRLDDIHPNDESTFPFSGINTDRNNGNDRLSQALMPTNFRRDDSIIVEEEMAWPLAYCSINQWPDYLTIGNNRPLLLHPGMSNPDMRKDLLIRIIQEALDILSEDEEHSFLDGIDKASGAMIPLEG